MSAQTVDTSKCMDYRKFFLLVVLFFSASFTSSAQEPSEDAATGESPLILSRVGVTQDRGEDDPGLFLSISQSEIDYLSPDHPAEVINTLPGVNVQMNSGQEHLIALRSPVLTGGAGQGSFLVLENGLPTRSSAFGNVNGLFEPVYELASDLEIVVGPGSAKYGSNAVHGLINIGLASPFEAQPQASISISSLGRQKLDALMTPQQGTAAGIVWLRDTGWRDSSSVDQQKIYLATEYQLAGWDALAWLSASNLNQETAGFIQGAKAYRDRSIAETNPNPEAYRDARSARAAIRLSRSSGDSDFWITPYFRWQEMEFRQHFLPYKGIEENGHHAFGLQARLDREISDFVTLRFGADADFASGFLIETQNDPFGFFPGDTRFPVGAHYDYDVETDVYAIWSELDWQLSGQFRVLAGLRGETHFYDYSTNIPAGINGRFNVADNRKDDFEFLTPKLGAVWELRDDAEIFANYARGARAPQASDLYRLQSQQLPSQARVETLDSFELGLRGRFGPGGSVQYQLAAYTADKENFFFRDADGLNVTNGTTKHEGVDALFRFEPWADVLMVDAALSWSDQTYTFDRPANGIARGNKIDTAPEWIADLAVTWQAANNWTLRAEAEYIGAYFTNPANSQDYPGHVVFHVGARYDLSNDIEAFARIRNLFDLKYADRADFAFGNERYFPGEPLNLTIGFQKSFGR